MKLIFKDTTEISISSSSNAYINTISKNETLTIRIDDPTITVSELVEKFTNENLSTFDVEVDKNSKRNYTNYVLDKIVDVLSDQVDSIEITLNKIQ